MTPQHGRFCRKHTAQPSKRCRPGVRTREPRAGDASARPFLPKAHSSAQQALPSTGKDTRARQEQVNWKASFEVTLRRDAPWNQSPPAVGAASVCLPPSL